MRTALLLLLPTTAFAGWPSIDFNSGGVGAIAVDSTGTVHAAHVDSAFGPGQLIYQTGDDSSINTGPIATVTQSGHVAITVSATDDVAIAVGTRIYENIGGTWVPDLGVDKQITDLGYTGDGRLVALTTDVLGDTIDAWVRDTSGVWTETRLYTNRVLSYDHAGGVAIDPSGNAHMGFLSIPTSGVFNPQMNYARLEPDGSWHTEVVGLAQASSDGDIAIGDDGSIETIYMDFFSGDVLVSVDGQFGWEDEVIGLGSQVGEEHYLSLDIDSNGDRHVYARLYNDRNGACDSLFSSNWYATDASGSWETDFLNRGFLWYQGDLAVGGDDRPWVYQTRYAGSFNRFAESRLRYFEPSPLSAEISVLTADPTPGGQVEFQMTVTNDSLLPLAFTEVSFEVNGSCSDDPPSLNHNPQTIWDRGPVLVPPGSSRSRTFSRTIPSGASTGWYSVEAGILGIEGHLSSGGDYFRVRP
jgi:hypothetical protein